MEDINKVDAAEDGETKEEGVQIPSAEEETNKTEPETDTADGAVSETGPSEAPSPEKAPDGRNRLIFAIIAAALAVMAILFAVYLLTNGSDPVSADTQPATTEKATEQTETSEPAADLPGSAFPYTYKKSDNNGAYKGKNVVVIEVPGLIEKLIGAEYGGAAVTPELNALLSESYHFKNVTAAAESASALQFVIDNSLYTPPYGNSVSYSYGTEFYGLPALLQNEGYETYSFSYGAEEKVVADQYAQSYSQPYGAGGKSSLALAAEKISVDKPFYAVISCGSSEYPYFTSGAKAFGGDGKAADYLGAIFEEDKRIGELISVLKKKNVYDDTVIVITGTPCAFDPENKTDQQALASKIGSYSLKDRITVPVIIKLGKAAESDKLTSQVDIMPALLDLLGLSGENTFFAGENMLTAERETVYIQNVYLRGSFVNGEKTVSADKTRTPRTSRAYDHSSGRTGSATGMREEMAESAAYFEDFDLAISYGIVGLAKKNGKAAAIAEFEGAKAEMKKIARYSVADVFPETESKDFYKNDVKLFHKAKMLTANEFDGLYDGVIFKNDGLILAPGVKEGVFISSDIDLGGSFDTLVASWNANTSGGTVEISVSAKKDDGNYTGWYSWGVWSQIEGTAKSLSSSDGDGKLDIDTLILKKKCSGAVRVKATLKQTGEASPALYNFTLAANLEKGLLSKKVQAASAKITLTKYYQMDVPDIGNRICSPTSLTMVIDSLGEKNKPAQTAAGVLDNGENIYGNWAFNVAYAGELGYNAYLDIYDMNAMMTALSKGTPVICSVAIKKGQLSESGYPNYSTSGHLLVITGFEYVDGELWLLSNDPAQNDVAVKYKASEFETIWRNVVYIVQKHPDRYTWRIGEGTDRDILIVADYVPEGRYNRPGGNFKVKYIVIHNTGNFSSGADAMSHRNYIKQDGTQTSWHFTVDDTTIYKHLPEEERAWHAGDGREGKGNTYGVGIEICVNHETLGETKCSKYLMEALENASVLAAELMHKYNLSIRAVTQHYDYSGKNCPQTIRECGLWDTFLQMIQTRYDEIAALRSDK